MQSLRRCDIEWMAWRKSEIDRTCECGWLESAAAEPSLQIEFDPDLVEFNLVHGDVGRPGRLTMRLYYCPFCGCRAPESKRSTRFAVLTLEESSRLKHLCEGLDNFADVRAKFGEPDDDCAMGAGEQRPEKDGQAPSATSFHTLTYRNLSETADVRFIDYREKGVHAIFFGKYIGPNCD